MYRIFNTCIEILSDSFYYYTTKIIEKLIDKERIDNINIISSLILVAFRMHIGPTKFLENGVPNIEFAIDSIIYE